VGADVFVTFDPFSACTTPSQPDGGFELPCTPLDGGWLCTWTCPLSECAAQQVDVNLDSQSLFYSGDVSGQCMNGSF
jgi:hypothetical protein